MEFTVEVFAMPADATRVRIILALRDGPLSVNIPAELVGKSPVTVSQHLAKLGLPGSSHLATGAGRVGGGDPERTGIFQPVGS